MDNWMGELDAVLNISPQLRLVVTVLLGLLALALIPALVVPAWRAWRTARRHRQWQAWARSAPKPLDEVAAELAADRQAALELWSGYMPQLRTPALPAPRVTALHGPRDDTEGAEVISFRLRPAPERSEAGAADA